MYRIITCLCLASLTLATFAADEPKPSAPADGKSVADTNAATPAPSYAIQELEGWTLHINKKLQTDAKDDLEKALVMLTAHLKEIERVIPAEPLAALKKVPFWLNPPYPGIRGHAEYHPAAGWLKEHHRDPAMAKGVEITNVSTFEAETKRMPVFILHELSHGYHDQVLSFKHPEIVAAYEKARDSKTYDKVERWHGHGPNTFERAYAMTNPMEYFAETSEAYFGRNDFFPFTREELEKHDPTMFAVLTKVWKVAK